MSGWMTEEQTYHEACEATAADVYGMDEYVRAAGSSKYVSAWLAEHGMDEFAMLVNGGSWTPNAFVVWLEWALIAAALSLPQ